MMLLAMLLALGLGGHSSRHPSRSGKPVASSRRNRLQPPPRDGVPARDGRFEPWAKVDASTTGWPNGLHAERDRLLLGSWVARGADGQDRFGVLTSVAFADQAVTPFGGHRVGNIDGIEQRLLVVPLVLDGVVRAFRWEP